MKNLLVVIPARISSTRLPKKPLIMIKGKPLIQWVYESVKATKITDDVIVATDDWEIKRVVECFGGIVELTNKDHESGTDRVKEVSIRHPEFEYVLNIQGDEPLVRKDWLEKLIEPLREGYSITTLCSMRDSREEFLDSNVVKVVKDLKNNSLFFSRAPIPFYRDNNNYLFYKHIGLYGFRAEFLHELSKLKFSVLEEAEKLEQLRFLDNGYSIKCNEVSGENLDINTKNDIDKFEKYLVKTDFGNII